MLSRKVCPKSPGFDLGHFRHVWFEEVWSVKVDVKGVVIMISDHDLVDYFFSAEVGGWMDDILTTCVGLLKWLRHQCFSTQ